MPGAGIIRSKHRSKREGKQEFPSCLFQSSTYYKVESVLPSWINPAPGMLELGRDTRLLFPTDIFRLNALIQLSQIAGNQIHHPIARIESLQSTTESEFRSLALSSLLWIDLNTP